MQALTLTRPDDWHLHLRDGAAMAAVLPHTARCFQRAIIMPNLKPPVTTVELALAYRKRILAALPGNSSFKPLMTLYLTEATPVAEIVRAKQSGHIHGIKLYPAGATTHSDAGVRDVTKTYDTLAAMEEYDLPLLVHGEVVDPHVDVFDREAVFVHETLAPLVERFPQLRVVLEHVTTQQAVDFVFASSPRVAATITPQHLLMNRNALFQGGIRPHHYCLPVLKREEHRRVLLDAAISGNPKFFLGTDSAPHPRNSKESPCGCAGIFSAHGALELYAEAFEQAGALNRLEGFASQFGADFYGLPRNTTTVRLEKQAWTVPTTYPMGDSEVVPLRAGDTITWRLAD